MAHRTPASASGPQWPALYLPLPHPPRRLQKSHLGFSLTYGSYLGSFLLGACFSPAVFIVSVKSNSSW